MTLQSTLLQGYGNSSNLKSHSYIKWDSQRLTLNEIVSHLSKEIKTTPPSIEDKARLAKILHYMGVSKTQHMSERSKLMRVICEVFDRIINFVRGNGYVTADERALKLVRALEPFQAASAALKENMSPDDYEQRVIEQNRKIIAQGGYQNGEAVISIRAPTVTVNTKIDNPGNNSYKTEFTVYSGSILDYLGGLDPTVGLCFSGSQLSLERELPLRTNYDPSKNYVLAGSTVHVKEMTIFRKSEYFDFAFSPPQQVSMISVPARDLSRGNFDRLKAAIIEDISKMLRVAIQGNYSDIVIEIPETASFDTSAAWFEELFKDVRFAGHFAKVEFVLRNRKLFPSFSEIADRLGTNWV